MYAYCMYIYMCVYMQCNIQYMYILVYVYFFFTCALVWLTVAQMMRNDSMTPKAPFQCRYWTCTVLAQVAACKMQQSSLDNARNSNNSSWTFATHRQPHIVKCLCVFTKSLWSLLAPVQLVLVAAGHQNCFVVQLNLWQLTVTGGGEVKSYPVHATVQKNEDKHVTVPPCPPKTHLLKCQTSPRRWARNYLAIPEEPQQQACPW